MYQLVVWENNMNFKQYDKTIKDLFSSQKQYSIPRFQRDYSWDNKVNKELFDDMFNSLKVEDKKLAPTQYFLGTMLFIGDPASEKSTSISCVDGQQRLTSITILFSAMSDKLRAENEKVLSDLLFSYIVTKDDNGQNLKILNSESHYPFFAYYIQSIDKNLNPPISPNSDEEERIHETYSLFMKLLDKNRLMRAISNNFPSVNLSYIDILKVLRDQILYSTLITIYTEDNDQANKIFEILNSKGKKLSNIDLIKNKLFEVLQNVVPVDFATERWTAIKSELSKTDEVGLLPTYYRHYWNSKYSKSTDSKLYQSFIRKITPKDSPTYTAFMNDLVENSSYYRIALQPDLKNDFANKQQFKWFIQSMYALNKVLGISQVRIAMLALIDLYKSGILSSKSFHKAIRFLEDFHFAFNGIVSGRGSKLEQIYSRFAIAFRSCANAVEADVILDKFLYKPLKSDLFPRFEDFENRFIALTYRSNDLNNKATNQITRYALDRLWSYYSHQEIFAVDATVEHILNQSTSGNIGNLILLETNINNNDACNKDYSSKKNAYNQSQYLWVKTFLGEYDSFSVADIEQRARKFAKILYDDILLK